MYGRKVRRGDKVRVLPPRGSAAPPDKRAWVIVGFEGTGEARQASLVERDTDDPETKKYPVSDLVVVADFREPMYPGLRSTGKVQQGGDKPFHTVINAENYHALEALLFTHRGKIDAIYIDPPYNTGAKDWKYNNDYVEGDDLYRHSKWLAFMERRLWLAKELLNPVASVLVITIDEKEYRRLGLLLEQAFPDARMQMVTSVISQNGTSRDDEFSRVEEYLYIVRFGRQGITRTNDNMLSVEGKGVVSRIWFNFMRTSNARETREGQFYPIIIDTAERRVVRIGDPPGKGVPLSDPPLAPNEEAVWPIRNDDQTATWGAVPGAARAILEEGFLRVGDHDAEANRWSIHYVRRGDRQRIDEGVIAVVSERSDGSKELAYVDVTQRRNFPKTVWNRRAHDATAHGTRLLKALLPGRKFPFPKALYAVEDVLRFFVADKPNATILDFFAGSGTTAHAVMRLNRQDGGRRRSISVTNNEVSADEQRTLRETGLRPGDPDWEALGICEFITKPRITAAVNGTTPNDKPIKGHYAFGDEYPMSDGFEENVEFFDLTYEDPERVRHGLSFEAIAPLLWLRAGCQGPRIETETQDFAVVETYAVLFNLDAAAAFVAAVRNESSLTTAYVVTDDETQFQVIAQQLPASLHTVRLYSAYLDHASTVVRD
jgi:adenine-specific DNA-methyltransferase